jgi:hypothetical protein
MNEPEFWEVLKDSELKWIGVTTKLRAKVEVKEGGLPVTKPVCPITAVCFLETGVFYPPTGWEEACQELELDEGFADDIIAGADYVPGVGVLGLNENDTRIRTQLYKAVGLEEYLKK